MRTNIAKTTYLKFAVLGPSGAGTTSFIQTVSDINEMENRGRLPVAHIAYQHIQVKLGLLPRAQDQWGIVLADKIGVLVLVDSTQPDQLAEVKSTMQAIRQLSSAPFIILANKQDRPGTLSPEAIRQKLGMGPDSPVLPCVAKDKNSITGVLHQLTNWAQARK